MKPFMCTVFDTHEYWTPDWHTVLAQDEEDAATSFAETHDDRTGEYEFATSGGRVLVREAGTDKISRYIITAESRPIYYAHLAPTSPPEGK